MTEPIKSDFWIITVIEKRLLDVQFEEPLTEDEAKRAFLSGGYEDVTDEETLETITVFSMEPIND